MQISAKTAAAAISLVVALAGVGVLGGDSAAGKDEHVADFTWTMPSRFGHHLSGKRLLKYPQSAAEVTSGPFPVSFELHHAACGPGVERHWTVGGAEVEAERAGGGCAFRLTFEREGAYDVELQVQGNGFEDVSTQRVVVQDLLIVGIGDSVASGEGNPDNRSFIHPTWQDTRCHRSSLAGTALAAAHAEVADPKSSVTFLHVACSGATVPRGLTGPYKGAQVGLFPRPRLLPPQLEQLEAVAGKREVDAVLLSVGGNDVGFANIVSFCILHRHCDQARIKESKLNLPGRSKVPLDDAVKASLAQLPGRYKNLNDGLRNAVSGDRVYVLEYFDATHATPTTFCDRILRGVDRDELRWAYEKVIVPLNAAIHAAADTHHWRYVSGVADAFAGHGYCAGPERWVRRIDESLRYQGFLNPKGTLHPTEEGHAKTAELIDKLLDPALFPAGVAREPRSPEKQDDQSLTEGTVPPELAVDGGTGDGQDDEHRALWGLGGAGLAAAAALGTAALRRHRRREAAELVEGAEDVDVTDREFWFDIAQFARIGGALAVIGVALGLILEDHPDPSRAAVVGALVAVATVLLILRPEDLRRLIERIERVKTPFGEALLSPATEGAKEAQPEETESEAPDAARSRDLLDLRLKLEAKMSYIAKILLAERDADPTGGDLDADKLRATYVTIGSLRHDRYLTENEAVVATQVLTLTDDDLRGLPADERRKFIANADRIVRGIRASVFRSMVRKGLSSAGWKVDAGTLSASSGGRPDFEVTKGEQSYRVVPVFATTSPSTILTNARKRLTDADQPELERRILVVPDRPGSPTIDEHPRTVKLRDLAAVLES